MKKVKTRIVTLILIFLGFTSFLVAGVKDSNARQSYPISQFIVGPTNQADYQQIQVALDSANKAGGGTVYVQPGEYVENLILYDKVDICAAIGVSDSKACVIKGTHKPPLHGSITVRNVFLESPTDVFNSSDNGDADIFLIDCTFLVKDGYVLNLPNWSGLLSGFNLGDMGSENNGGINNLGGSQVCLYNLTLGCGTKNPMRLSGPLTIFNVIIQPPLELKNNASGLIGGGSLLRNTVSFFDDSSLKFYHVAIDTDASSAIKYYSSGDTLFAQVVITSSNDLVIDGKSRGKIIVGSVVFTNKVSISPHISVNDHGTLITGHIADISSYSDEQVGEAMERLK